MDLAAVLEEDALAMGVDTDAQHHLWIYKPSSGNRGRGVHVVRGGAELQGVVASYVGHYHPTLMASDVFKGMYAGRVLFYFIW
jgi:hypothetical protein